MMKRLSLLLVTLFALPLILSACGGSGVPGLGGGGGGGSEDGNPAEVRLKASPEKLDSGDIVNVEVRITDVAKPMVLKVKHHESLAYIPDSIVLFGDRNPGPNIPTPTDFGVNGETTRYLVVPFYTPAHFGEKGRGTLTFNFQATSASNEKIEIDIDEFEQVPTSGLGFDPRTPRFSTLDEVRIRIEEDSD